MNKTLIKKENIVPSYNSQPRHMPNNLLIVSPDKIMHTVSLCGKIYKRLSNTSQYG